MPVVVQKVALTAVKIREAESSSVYLSAYLTMATTDPVLTVEHGDRCNDEPQRTSVETRNAMVFAPCSRKIMRIRSTSDASVDFLAASNNVAEGYILYRRFICFILPHLM